MITIQQLDTLFYRYTHWHIGEIINFAIPVFIGLYILSDFYHTDFTGNPLFWHETKGIHHFWDLLGLYLFYFVMKYLFKFSSMKSLICLVFIVAVEEEAWYITYYITNPDKIFAMTWIFSPVNIAYALVIVFYLFYINRAKLPIPSLFIIWVILIFGVWGANGFHVTVDPLGNTTYLMDIQTNLIELSHWIVGIIFYAMDCIIFLIVQRDYTFEQMQKIDES